MGSLSRSLFIRLIRLHGLRRLHGLKLRDWIGRDVERSFCWDWIRHREIHMGDFFRAGIFIEKEWARQPRPYGLVRSRNLQSR